MQKFNKKIKDFGIKLYAGMVSFVVKKGVFIKYVRKKLYLATE